MIDAADGTPAGSKAVAKKGYRFVKWVDGNGFTVSLEATLIPTRNPLTNEYESGVYTAIFAKDDVTVKILPQTGDNLLAAGVLILLSGIMTITIRRNKKDRSN